MTTRYAAFLVTLTDDIREDDAEWTLNALRMVRGVASVSPVPATIDQAIAYERRDRVWAEALYRLAKDGPLKDPQPGSFA